MKYLEVINKSTGKVVHRINVSDDEGRAKKTEDGLNINLNHKNFYTEIVESSTILSII